MRICLFAERLEDPPDLSGTLLRVAFLTARVVDIGHTKPSLVAFRPLKVTVVARSVQAAVYRSATGTYSIRLQAI